MRKSRETKKTVIKFNHAMVYKKISSNIAPVLATRFELYGENFLYKML